MLSPCYDDPDSALEQAEAVVRSWTIGRPLKFRLLLSIREEEPFFITLARYEAAERAGGPAIPWLSALVLREERCGWLWVAAATTRRHRTGGHSVLTFHASIDREWRFWIALGEALSVVREVQCVYSDGSTASTQPVDGAFLIGGRLRGPKRLVALADGGRVLENHDLPRALSYQLPPQDGPPRGAIDVERLDRMTVADYPRNQAGDNDD